MQKYTDQQYNNIFKKLPAPIKDLVASTSTSEKIFKIAERHKMQVDQAGILNDLVLDALMGIVATKDLRKEVVKETGVSEMAASLALRDIDDEILKPVKELMFTMYADGAPFKPKESKLVDETEEDHLELKKEDILNEIENPAPSEVKKVTVTIPEKIIETPRESVPQSLGTLSSSHEVEEYHQELAVGSGQWAREKKEIKQIPEIKKEIPKAEERSADSLMEESKKRILDNIGAIKLQGVVTMPKTEQEIKETFPKTSSTRTSQTIPIIDSAKPPVETKKPFSEIINQGSETNPKQNFTASKNTPPKAPEVPQTKPSGGDPYREPIE